MGEIIFQQKNNVRIYSELYEVNMEDLPPRYQEVHCHIIIYVNRGYNFRHKHQMVAEGNKTTTPQSLNYFQVVSQDSANIALTITKLDHLKAIACNIHHSHLSTKLQEKIWTMEGLEFDFRPRKGHNYCKGTELSEFFWGVF